MTQQTTGAVQRLATRIVFFIAGYVTATWAVLVPYAKANTGVNEATLGSLLLCLGMGALIAMPLTGMLTSRYGCRRVIVTAMALVLLTTPCWRLFRIRVCWPPPCCCSASASA